MTLKGWNGLVLGVSTEVRRAVVRFALIMFVIGVLFGAVDGWLITYGVTHQHQHPHPVKLCDKPSEDSDLSGCHLDYRDGAWWVAR